MKYLILLTVLMLNTNCVSQKKELKPPFNTQGEQEDYWAQEFFKDKYKKTSYEIYSNEIKCINNEEFIYDNKSFNIYDIDDTLKIIFSKGLLYPQLISGFTNEPRKSDEELDSLTNSEKYFYELTRGDSYTITVLEELNFLSNSSKVKRFVMWIFRPQTANPTAYLFELSNKKANESTTMKEFIEDSKLTFLKKGWLVR